LEAKLQRYGVVVIVGIRNVESGSLTVDFSAIPDYRYDIREGKLLKNILEAYKEYTQEKHNRFSNWGRVWTPDDEGFQDDPTPRRLEVAEIKAFQITARTLRKVLNGLQTSYV